MLTPDARAEIIGYTISNTTGNVFTNHAYDKLTGKLLWDTFLPAAGNVTPSVYEIGGSECMVIVCGGGQDDGPSGSSFVAFALPKQK